MILLDSLVSRVIHVAVISVEIVVIKKGTIVQLVNMSHSCRFVHISSQAFLRVLTFPSRSLG